MFDDFFLSSNYFKKNTNFFAYNVNRWQPFKRKFQEKNFIKIKENELLLGYEPEDLDYETKVTIPFNPNKRITIVITGDNDSGKSVFAQFLISQLRYRFNRYIAFIDPKDDTYNMESPNTNPEFIKILKKYGIKPTAHKLIRLYPKFANFIEVKGVSFIPSLFDFIGSDRIILTDRLAQFFEIEKSDPALPLLCGVMLSNNPPKTLIELLNRIEQLQEAGIGERVKKLKAQIILKTMTEQLSDKPTNIPELLYKIGMLVFKIPLIKEQTNLSDSITSLFISNLMTEREKSILGKGILNRPVSIICDEADKYAGTNTITNSLLSQITTKFRSLRNTAGLDSILVTQHAAYLDATQVLEADYIFGVKLTMKQDIELLKVRALNEIHNITNLEYVINQHPKIFWCLNKNGEVKYFKPLPAPNSMPQQKN